MRREEELYPEDLERVRKITSTGIHSVERQPFRGLRLLWIVIGVVLMISAASWVVGTIVGDIG